jgi:hypothetical protein
MIVCSNCRHANIAGAVFCSECGAPLAPTTSATHDIGSLQEPEAPPAKAGAQEAPAEAPPVPSQGLADNWLTLHLLDTGQMLPLAERNEFTLGRISEGQPIMPDIDLSPYQAYANGVSRLHAVIKRGMDSIVLMDLGSANGTFLNGKRLNPNVEKDLANGDVVALGRLKIQILLKQA